MGKVKILRIIARLNVGGPARHVVLLAAGLNGERFESVLVHGGVGEGEGDMAYLAEQGRIRREFIPELGRGINPFTDLAALVKIISLIRRERPHIVHTHTAKAGTLGRIAGLLTGVPAKVHTFHGHVFRGYFNRVATGYFLWIERMLARFTDRIVAISKSQKDDLLCRYKIGREDQYRVVNLGLDLEPFSRIENLRGLFRQRHALGKDSIVVAIIGRLVPIKNHRMFINVISLIKESVSADMFDKLKFVIVGDGPEKGSLIKYADSKGVGASVVFTGWEKDLQQVYADVDIVALTSRNEGTPVSLIEAFASSRPVIATDAGGVKDVVGGIGIMIDRDDEAAFAKALTGLILSPEARAEIGSKGRESVMNRFSMRNLLSQTEKLYEELLTEKGISA